MKNFFLLLAVAFCGTIFAQTKTVTFKPDAITGKDVNIYNHFGCIATGQTKAREDRNFLFENLYQIIAWTYNNIGCSQGVGRGLLEFEELSTIPRNAVIVSAELKLFGVPNGPNMGTGNSNHPGSAYNGYGSNQSHILRITSEWDKQTVTWNTQPTTTTKNKITIPQTTTQWNWDFTDSSDNLVAMVQDMVTNPETNFGFMIRLDTEQYYRNILFATSRFDNPALWPQLTVSYYVNTVSGCTDHYAENYNPQATVSDGNCTYRKIDEPIAGCTDPAALNYNPIATVDGDDDCVYETQVIFGCTDPKALNYNPKATDYDYLKDECHCVYADDENTFPPTEEITETPVDTLGTWAVEECWFTAANIVSAKITELVVSDIDESGNNHGKNKPPHLHAYAEWEIIRELGGENNSRIDTIRERIQYCIDGKNSSIDNQPTLFYMSVVCKNPLYVRSGKDTPEVVGYTFSAFAYLRSGFSTDISQPVAESKNNVAVYPNPFSDKLTVLVKGAKTADIALYSIDGNLLATYRNLNEVEIATSKLPAGVYVVKVTVGGKKESVTVVKK